MLDDGTYDALVFDADEDGDTGAIIVELTILGGERKGEVVSLRTDSWTSDAIQLLGIPATVTVTDGKPSVVFEP